jgi:hypothetical protein
MKLQDFNEKEKLLSKPSLALSQRLPQNQHDLLLLLASGSHQTVAQNQSQQAVIDSVVAVKVGAALVLLLLLKIDLDVLDLAIVPHQVQALLNVHDLVEPLLEEAGERERQQSWPNNRVDKAVAKVQLFHHLHDLRLVDQPLPVEAGENERQPRRPNSNKTVIRKTKMDSLKSSAVADGNFIKPRPPTHYFHQIYVFKNKLKIISNPTLFLASKFLGNLSVSSEP